MGAGHWVLANLEPNSILPSRLLFNIISQFCAFIFYLYIAFFSPLLSACYEVLPYLLPKNRLRI